MTPEKSFPIPAKGWGWARPINGISLNGREFALTDNQDEILTFPTRSRAWAWGRAKGITQEQVDEGSVELLRFKDLG